MLADVSLEPPVYSALQVVCMGRGVCAMAVGVSVSVCPHAPCL
jgi:hypothetical protein